MGKIGNEYVLAPFIETSRSFPGRINLQNLDHLCYRIKELDDYNAFEILFNQMYKPLCCSCIKLVLLREVAEEVVSDVFYSIWKNRKRLEIMSLRSYLYCAVRNRCLDYLRARRKIFCDLEEAVHLPAENFTLHDVLEHEELEASFYRRVNLLPKQCKIIYELSRAEGMKYKEIAAVLRISVKTVETHLGKALKELRKVKEYSDS